MAERLEENMSQVYLQQSRLGHRKLATNEFRASETPGCSLKLFASRVLVFPGSPFEMHRERAGVISTDGSKSVLGTWIHEGMQENLVHSPEFPKLTGPGVLNCEPGVLLQAERVVKQKFDNFSVSGHVDLVYMNDDRQVEICDIKTVSVYVFPIVAGVREAKSRNYSVEKRNSSILQAMLYAYMMRDLERHGIDVSEHFTIMWVNRENGDFKLERVPHDENELQALLDKLRDVQECVNMFRAFSQIRRVPRFAGVCMCEFQSRSKTTHYCRYHCEEGGPCPGMEAIADMDDETYQRVVVAAFQNFSEHASTVRTAEQVVEEHTVQVNGEWRCSICNALVSELVDVAQGWFMIHHLFYEHNVRDFDTSTNTLGRAIMDPDEIAGREMSKLPRPRSPQEPLEKIDIGRKLQPPPDDNSDLI